MSTETTDQLIAKHAEPIAERLRALQRALATFTQSLAHSAETTRRDTPTRPVTVYEPIMDREGESARLSGFNALSTKASRRTAAEAYAQIDYREGDAVNQSIKCYGVIGAPRALIEEAKRINRLKDELREAIAPVANRRVRLPGKDATGQRTVLVRELTTVILRQIGSSSLNVLAAYRELPVIDEPVHKIQFRLTQTRSVPRKTVADVRKMLSQNPGSLTNADLKRLAALPDNEYLVSPKPYYTRMRALVYFQRTEPDRNNSGKRVQASRLRSAELPVLFPMTAQGPEPQIIAPKLPRAGKHPPGRIEPGEVVTSLHYFRMKPDYRAYA